MTHVAHFAPSTAPPRVPRRRLAIAGDGSVTGDATSQQLGAELRYACRMASQIEPLLDLGPLEWVTTLSGTGVTARVGRDAGGLTVNAEIEEQTASTLSAAAPPTDADSAQSAVRKSLHLLRDGLAAEWCALITWDKRLVGALLPDAVSRSAPLRAVLSDVGLRAMAVLGSFEEAYRETAVVLEYAHGSLIVVAVGNDVLFASADKVDKTRAGQVISDVRSVLAPYDMEFVWTWGASWSQA